MIPQRGDKKQLLDLSERNVSYFRLDRERQRNLKKEDSSFNILKTIKLELKLPTLPHRMECFDNSNIQGTNPVASCVVFIDGKPAKRISKVPRENSRRGGRFCFYGRNYFPEI